MPDLPNNVTVPDWDKWQPDIEATLVFIHQGSRVLLIEKLRGIGMGKINGPGGKIDPGETPLECAVREGIPWILYLHGADLHHDET